jgi:hypothetical protein
MPGETVLFLAAKSLDSAERDGVHKAVILVKIFYNTARVLKICVSFWYNFSAWKIQARLQYTDGFTGLT